MKRKHVPILLLIGFILAGVYGCGGGGGGGDVTIASGPGGAGTALALNAPSAVCASCHGNPASGSPQVAPAYLDASGNVIPGSPTIVAEYSRSLHNQNLAATCAQCHVPPPGQTHPAIGAPSPDESGICLNCHNPAGMGLPHFNNATVNTVNGFIGTPQQAQYVDNINNVSGLSKCVGCHNPHDTTSLMPLLQEYSRNSGHGDVDGDAWKHYRWKDNSTTPLSTDPATGKPLGSRAACQRCHTTTGFLAKINGELGLVGTTRVPDYSRKYPTGALLDVSGNGNATTITFDVSGNATKDNTKQVLRCDGCHDNLYRYDLRKPIAVTAEYSYDGVVYTGTHTVPYPDIGKSNLCMNCHVGRENGDSIKLLNWVGKGTPPVNTAADYSNISFVNSHYLTGGATVFADSGYTFTGPVYSGPVTHSTIGGAGPGSSGPCVGCHMTPIRHTFKPVTLAADGTTIASVASTLCQGCHVVGSGTFEITTTNPNNLIALKAQYDAALNALDAALQTRGFFWSSANPYVFNGPNGTGGSKTNWLSFGDADITGAATGKNNMGAAFNLNLLRHDFGAFAHNTTYVRQIVYDSIDWIDGNPTVAGTNVLNNSTGNTIDTLLAGNELTRQNARTYLCGGAIAVGAPCPRP